MGSIFGHTLRSAKGFRSLHAREVHSLLQNNQMPVIIDVRTRTEYESNTGNLHGSMLMPLHDLEAHISELLQFKEKQIIVYCRAGHRSKEAARILSKNGFDVIDIDGGIEEWIMSDLPVNNKKL